MGCVVRSPRASTTTHPHHPAPEHRLFQWKSKGHRDPDLNPVFCKGKWWSCLGKPGKGVHQREKLGLEKCRKESACLTVVRVPTHRELRPSLNSERYTLHIQMQSSGYQDWLSFIWGTRESYFPKADARHFYHSIPVAYAMLLLDQKSQHRGKYSCLRLTFLHVGKEKVYTFLKKVALFKLHDVNNIIFGPIKILFYWLSRLGKCWKAQFSYFRPLIQYNFCWKSQLVFWNTHLQNWRLGIQYS